MYDILFELWKTFLAKLTCFSCTLTIGIAIRLEEVDQTQVFIDENGGTKNVCFIKRSGTITDINGLTVDILFTIPLLTIGAGKL